MTGYYGTADVTAYQTAHPAVSAVTLPRSVFAAPQAGHGPAPTLVAFQLTVPGKTPTKSIRPAEIHASGGGGSDDNTKADGRTHEVYALLGESTTVELIAPDDVDQEIPTAAAEPEPAAVPLPPPVFSGATGLVFATFAARRAKRERMRRGPGTVG